MTQQRPDDSVPARKIQHPQRAARAAGGTHWTMNGVQHAGQHRRHAVAGRPQRSEVGARVFEIVDPVEVVLVPRKDVGRIGHL